MKKSSLAKILFPLAIVIGAIALGYLIVASKAPPEKEDIVDKAFLVEAQTVYFEPVEFAVYSQGNVVPKNRTNVSTQVSGTIVSVSDVFVEGGFFNKGDVLLTLEQDDFLTEVKLAEAELAQMQASLEEEIARGKVAEQEWRSVNGSVPPELGLRKPQLAREQANLNASKAKLERAKRNLARTKIIAPYNGIVVSRNVDLGQFIGVGTQVAEIYSTDIAEVRLPITNSDLAYLNLEEGVKNNNSVYFTARVAGELQQWQGTLVRSEGVLDQGSRVIYAIAQVEDPYDLNTKQHIQALRFGQFVQAVITGTNVENVVVLPRKLLRLDGTVLTVGEDRTLTIKDVVVARSDAERVYVRSGLKSSDNVVTSPVPNAFTGMKVRLPEDAPEVDQPTKLDASDNTEQIDASGDE